MPPEAGSNEASNESPMNVVDAVTAPKQPPPETKESIYIRRMVLLSFWAVAIFLGLPFWWRTTMVYRAPLPLQQMLDWADGKICRPTFPLRIAVEAPSLPAQEAQHLLRTTQHALDDLNDFSSHHLRLLLADNVTASKKEDMALLVRLNVDTSGATPRAELHPYDSIMDVFYAPNQTPSSSSTGSPLASLIASQLQQTFDEEQAVLAHAMSSTTWQTSHMKPIPPEMQEVLEKRKTRTFKYAPTYHLTFSLFSPTALPSDWDIEGALRDYIEPLLASLSVMSKFTVDSQVQLYATLSPSISGPQYDEDRKVWKLKKEDLSGFINAAEWPLSPSIGDGPTLNFILYVPAPEQTPLLLDENGGTSWVIPQWGGIQILNAVVPGHSPEQRLSRDSLEQPMKTFSEQLLSLLGFPQHPASFPLRLNTLVRAHAASLIFSASSTLGAIARLTQQLSSIAIPDTVARDVEQTMMHLQTACTCLREGRFHKALDSAKQAECKAERAFFDPSMVAMVYFPDEHKVAVYLPLLGPVAVPLFMSALKEIKALRAQWRFSRIKASSG